MALVTLAACAALCYEPSFAESVSKMHGSHFEPELPS